MNTIKLFKDLTFKEGDDNLFQVQLLQNDTAFSIPPEAVVKMVLTKNKELVSNRKVAVDDAPNGIISFSISTNIGTGLFDCEFIVNDGANELTFPSGLPATLYVVDDLGTNVTVDRDTYDILIEQIQDIELETQSTTIRQDALEQAMDELTGNLTDGLDGVVKEEQLAESLATKADAEHTHTIEDTVGLEDALNAKAPVSHTHAEYLTEHQSLDHLALVDHTHAEITEIQDALSTKANVNHTHDTFKTMQEQIDKKAPAEHLHTIAEVKGLTANLADLAKADHTHTIDKIEGLQNALDAKVDGEHTHQIADVNNLQAELNKKSNLNHTHAIFTTFRNDIDAKAPKKHTHTMAEVSGLTAKLNTLTDADTNLTNNLQATRDTMNTLNNDTNNKINTVNSNLKTSIADTDKKLTKEIATKVSISSFSNYQAQQQTTDYRQNQEIATLDETLTELREEVANIQLSGVTGEIEVLTTEEIETMWKEINDK